MPITDTGWDPQSSSDSSAVGAGSYSLKDLQDMVKKIGVLQDTYGKLQEMAHDPAMKYYAMAIAPKLLAALTAGIESQSNEMMAAMVGSNNMGQINDVYNNGGSLAMVQETAKRLMGQQSKANQLRSQAAFNLRQGGLTDMPQYQMQLALGQNPALTNLPAYQQISLMQSPQITSQRLSEILHGKNLGTGVTLSPGWNSEGKATKTPSGEFYNTGMVNTGENLLRQYASADDNLRQAGGPIRPAVPSGLFPPMVAPPTGSQGDNL